MRLGGAWCYLFIPLGMGGVEGFSGWALVGWIGAGIGEFYLVQLGVSIGGTLAAFGPTMFLGVWVYIRFFCDGGLRFRPYGESPFPDAEKVTEKALLLRSARSLGLGVPSLRDRSGRSAYGLLRCTSSRCVWLRQTVAALPPPDQSLHSAFRCRLWIKIKIKIKSRRADTRPIEW